MAACSSRRTSATSSSRPDPAAGSRSGKEAPSLWRGRRDLLLHQAPPPPPASEEQPQVKKLLAQHIETVHHSETVGDVLHSLLLADSTKEIKSKTKEWNDRIKQDKKPDQLRSEARQRHEPVATFLESQWTQIQEKIRSQRKRTWCFWLVCAPSSLGLSFLVYSNKLKGEKVVKRLKRLEAEKGRLQVKELAKGAEEA